MTEGKENVEASKDTSESMIAEIDKEPVEDEKEEDDDHMEEDQMSEEEETEEEDREGGDQDKGNDQITDAHLQPKHQLRASDNTEECQADNHPNKVANCGDAVNCGKNGDADLHKEEPTCEENDDHYEEVKTRGSGYKASEMPSNVPVPDKSIASHVEADEKNYETHEQVSLGPHDEDHHDAVSNGNECSARVKSGENIKKVTTLVDNIGKAKDVTSPVENNYHNQTFMCETTEGGEAGTEEEQSAFMKALETFCREKSLEFKPPKFYGEPLNLLKLWRAVIKLGGYDKVTACKLWRQVGESFNPPKTCTTVSWTFRIFYEKALLEYERHKITGGELDIPATVMEPVSMESPVVNSQASGSGRARRDAAARAMQGWHSQRLLGNGEVSDPIIKDKSSLPLKSREKHLKNIGGQKRKKPMGEPAIKASHSRLIKGPSDTAVIDVGPVADWVKVNVRTTKDCYEVYALVPGLLREEVRVQSDPAGRLVITGEPEHADNPWGVTPFKKVVSLPSRIDPHQTSAVVTLHGQLFVRVPFEQSDNL